jgi:hypothetical protein
MVSIGHPASLAFCLSMIFSENRCPLFRIMLLFEHDLFGKPVSTFPDHAPAGSLARLPRAGLQDAAGVQAAPWQQFSVRKAMRPFIAS